jgi:hypothetical protein
MTKMEFMISEQQYAEQKDYTLFLRLLKISLGKDIKKAIVL